MDLSLFLATEQRGTVDNNIEYCLPANNIDLILLIEKDRSEKSDLRLISRSGRSIQIEILSAIFR